MPEDALLLSYSDDVSAKLQSLRDLNSKENEIIGHALEVNALLQERIKTIETNLEAFKALCNQRGEAIEELQKTIQQQNYYISTLKESNPIAACVIDGDGAIFPSELIAEGQNGGHKAAAILLNYIKAHLAQHPTDITSEHKVIVNIFLNQAGLRYYLSSTGACTAEQFDQFVFGFNLTDPLVNMIDVGNVKEAADTKVRDSIKFFAEIQQVQRIYLAGVNHDGGYVPELMSLKSRGLLEKVFLVQARHRSPAQMKILIDKVFSQVLSFNDLFMKDYPPASYHRLENVSPVKPSTPLPAEGSPSIGSSTGAMNEMSTQKPGLLRPNKALRLTKQTPKICNFYYSGLQCRGPGGGPCNYSHDYYLEESEKAQLRKELSELPCVMLNNRKPCHWGSKCVYAHKCPKGAKCPKVNGGKVFCQFRMPGMHDSIQEGAAS